MRVSGWGGWCLPWGGAPWGTMFATLRGGIQSLSPRPGGGIQSLSPLRGGPRSAGIQSASDRGGPGNLPGKPGPTGLGPKPSSIGDGAIGLDTRISSNLGEGPCSGRGKPP